MVDIYYKDIEVPCFDGTIFILLSMFAISKTRGCPVYILKELENAFKIDMFVQNMAYTSACIYIIRFQKNKGGIILKRLNTLNDVKEEN